MFLLFQVLQQGLINGLLVFSTCARDLLLLSYPCQHLQCPLLSTIQRVPSTNLWLLPLLEERFLCLLVLLLVSCEVSIL